MFSLGILSTKTANNATGDERDSDIISIFSGEYALTISSTTPLGFWATRIRKLSPGMFEYDKFSMEDGKSFGLAMASVRYDLLARYNSSPIYLFLGDRG